MRLATLALILATAPAAAGSCTKASVGEYRASYLRARAYALAHVDVEWQPSCRKVFAEGYIAKGTGTGRSVSIPAMISNGEAVIPERVVSRYRPLVEALVRDRLPRFADGRMPDPAAFSAALGASVANLLEAPATRSTEAVQSVAQASRGERAPAPLTFSPTYTIDARGTDPGIETRLKAMLDARDKALPQTIRELQRRAG